MRQPLSFNDYDPSEIIESLHDVNDYIRWVTTCLYGAKLSYGHGYADAIDEALVLVLHSINMSPPVIPEMLQSRLSQTEKSRIIELLERRINKRVPLAYLIQRAPFAGLDFYVDERVLIPRSPIAELIEQGFEPWLQGQNVARVLDLCCGSGCIGIAFAYTFSEAQVDLVDVSKQALDVARLNVEEHGMDEAVEVIQSDLFTELDGRVYDLIVTNPPYVPQASYDALPNEFEHEPGLGLVSGIDGLDHIATILDEAEKHLTAEGWLCAEVGEAREALEQRWPTVPFIWPDFERGGEGVFLLDAKSLQRHF